MKSTRKYNKYFLILLSILLVSCMDMEEINRNPNGVDPSIAHPDLLMSTIITETGKMVVGLGYGHLAGVMQHTQKDGWSGGHNSYDWGPSDQDWGGYYAILRNVDEMYRKSVERDLEFQQGVALIFRAYVFGLITDLWGDAPYTNALKGYLGGEEYLVPKFDSQELIYAGILADLDSANTRLSQKSSAYLLGSVTAVQDVLYQANVERWRKFANSLALRYYMRLSEKQPEISRAGIEMIVGDPEGYPIILNTSDDASMLYPGTSDLDSWPANTIFDGTGGSNFRRLKMCATLVDTLQGLNDPRLGLWAAKIDIPLVVVDAPADRDEIVDGVRYVGPDVVDPYVTSLGFQVDEDPEYVGLPPAWSIIPQAYNLNPNLEQAPHNPHASHLNDRYMNASGDLLVSRMMSAAEVHFIIAEAALNGWTTESAQEHYEDAVKSSFDAWGIGGVSDDYLLNAGVSYEGTTEQIMEQKWIASWTAAAESWFDYRRTGLPALQHGTEVKRDALPIRFYYSVEEMDYNLENTLEAIDGLETTGFSAEDGKNSAWSKMWLLQGTGKPY
ncbi:MAG: SusD/RagB family nutrient-binding outer membrane lipoprotein [Bacteroidota bacterium]